MHAAHHICSVNGLSGPVTTGEKVDQPRPGCLQLNTSHSTSPPGDRVLGGSRVRTRLAPHHPRQDRHVISKWGRWRRTTTPPRRRLRSGGRGEVTLPWRRGASCIHALRRAGQIPTSMAANVSEDWGQEDEDYGRKTVTPTVIPGT
jgi:hypothetical protein